MKKLLKMLSEENVMFLDTSVKNPTYEDDYYNIFFHTASGEEFALTHSHLWFDNVNAFELQEEVTTMGLVVDGFSLYDIDCDEKLKTHIKTNVPFYVARANREWCMGDSLIRGYETEECPEELAILEVVGLTSNVVGKLMLNVRLTELAAELNEKNHDFVLNLYVYAEETPGGYQWHLKYG